MCSDLGLEPLVDPDPPAALDLQAGVVQVEVIGLALPSRRVHHRLGGNLLAAGQGGDGARGADVDRGHFLAEPERHRQVAQVEFQRLDHLGVAEVEHVVALLHDGHLGAQRGEHRGVLDADHTGADDDHRGRQRLEIEDPVGVEAARLLTYRAAEAFDRHERCDMEAGMAKYFATEAAVENATEAMRIHGAYGYSKEFNIERLYRDAPLLVIGEGTNELQRIIIARQLVARNPV